MSVDPSEDARGLERRAAALWNIRVDVATGRVSAALRERGVECIVLKGAALRELYPADATRTYMDGDVWIAPDQVAVAESVLERLGYRPKIDERGMPEWWLEHASAWSHQRDGTAIDLHRRLQGVGVDDGTAWELMRAEAEVFEVGGAASLRLGWAACAMYLALHAGHHGRRHESAIAHVEAAARALDASTWTRAAELARELRAQELFTVGIRLAPSGAHVAERLGLDRASSAAARLQASTPPPVARGFAQLSTAGPLARLELLLRKLVPPPGFIRYWWRPASRGPLLLAVGYLYRPLWLLVHAPAGWRAWRRAQAQSPGLPPHADADADADAERFS